MTTLISDGKNQDSGMKTEYPGKIKGTAEQSFFDAYILNRRIFIIKKKLEGKNGGS